MMLKAILTIALASFAFAAVHAQTADRLGPPVGSKLPFELALADQTGATRTLADLSGSKGVVLIYVRSLDWCPFCKAQISEAMAAVGQFGALGYGVASVSYDPPETLAAFAAEQDPAPGFVMLSDKASATIDALGIRNAEVPAGSRFAGIPHPIVFVVARDGTITQSFWLPGYKDRPKLADILAALGG